MAAGTRDPTDELGGWEGLLGLSFTIHPTRGGAAHGSGHDGARVMSSDRKGGDRGDHGAMAEKGSRELTATLVLIPTLTLVPEIYPLIHKKPLGVRDKIL